MPRASIIIATHNRPHLLPRAVQSAQAAGTDIEVIVADDASSPETQAVCRDLPGIKYLRIERNVGLGGARNVGIVASTGEYLAFLDDDDVRLPGSLDTQIALLEKNSQVGLVYGQALIRTGDGKQAGEYPQKCLQGDVFWQLVTQNFIPCGAAVFRRSCLSRVGLLNDGIRGIEDWDLWIRIAELYEVVALPSPVFVWRKGDPGSGQLTSRADQMTTVCVRQFREWMKLPRALNAPTQRRNVMWREFCKNLAAHLLFESLRAFSSGHHRQGLKNLGILPRLSPLALVSLARDQFFNLTPRRIEKIAAPLRTKHNQLDS